MLAFIRPECMYAEIIASKGPVDRYRSLPCGAHRHQNPRGKNRIEKRRGVTDEDETLARESGGLVSEIGNGAYRLDLNGVRHSLLQRSGVPDHGVKIALEVPAVLPEHFLADDSTDARQAILEEG